MNVQPRTAEASTGANCWSSSCMLAMNGRRIGFGDRAGGLGLLAGEGPGIRVVVAPHNPSDQARTWDLGEWSASALNCRRCGTRMRRRKNPFFGVGLAVHEYIASCPECEYVEFIPPARQEEPEVDRPPERSALQRLFRRTIGR
jgi:hypothetical protein